MRGEEDRHKTLFLFTALWVSGGVVAPLWASEGGAEFNAGDLGQAITSIVIFFVLLWVLKRWAWGPLVQQLHQREKTIVDAVAKAEQREQEATDLMNFYKAKLEAAAIDAQEVINTSRREAGHVRDQILTTAREEARKSAESARQEVERAKEDALRSLHQSTAELATDIAGRVLKKDLSPDDQRRLLEHSLAEIRKQAKKE